MGNKCEFQLAVERGRVVRRGQRVGLADGALHGLIEDWITAALKKFYADHLPARQQAHVHAALELVRRRGRRVEIRDDLGPDRVDPLILRG